MHNSFSNNKAHCTQSKINDYDTIIIGAGIGGLVCGCYLAKAGMKVLLIEQHDKPGGYCTSFTRKGFTFEAGALESLRKGSQFRKIVDDLKIGEKIQLIRSDPSILLVTPDYQIKINNNGKKTINELQIMFPHQAKEIEKFFNFIFSPYITKQFDAIRKISYDKLLERFVTDKKLIAILKALVAQIGVPSKRLSSLTAIIHLKEFIFDSGYYPRGGFYGFANAFASRFIEFGGKILLSTLVKRIIIHNGQATGVVTDRQDHFSSKYIVSNADAKQTYTSLIGKKNLPENFLKKFEKLIPSISVFAVYIGINRNLKKETSHCYELCYIPTYQEDDPWDPTRLKKKDLQANLYCYFPSFQDNSLAPKNSESISVGIYTPPLSKVFWDKNKNRISDAMIKKIENFIPNLSKSIVVKEIATPFTFFRYTLNQKGAIRGWAAFSSQINKTIMPQTTPINNLYLASHWVTLSSGEYGMPMSAYAGFRIAKLIRLGMIS